MCGTISPPILLKRDSRSVMRMKPSSSIMRDVAGDVPAVAHHFCGPLRLLQIARHQVRAVDQQQALLADERPSPVVWSTTLAATPGIGWPTEPGFVPTCVLVRGRRRSGALTATTGAISVQP